MEKRKVSMISLGCAKNLVDAEVMLGYLPQQRFEIITDEALADIIIVNTCGFISDAKEESVETLLEAIEYKKSGQLQTADSHGLSVPALCRGYGQGTAGG